MVEIFAALRDFLKKSGVAKLIYKCIPYIYHSLPAEEDRYALFLGDARLFLTYAPDYGRFDVAFNDGAPQPIDLYSGLGVFRQLHTVVMIPVRVGRNTISFGLRPDALGRSKLGIDTIQIRCSDMHSLQGGNVPAATEH